MQARSFNLDTKSNDSNVLFLLTSPDRGTRGSVGRCLASVCVDRDSRVALGSIAGDVGEIVAAGASAAASTNYDLSAFGVELGSVGLVKSKEFVADEIVARSKAAGDVRLPVQVLQDIVGSPSGTGQRRCSHALLVDLLDVSTDGSAYWTSGH